MLDEDKVKEEAAGLYLADVVHKFWVWFLLQSVHLVDVLKMLCTFTTGCSLGKYNFLQGIRFTGSQISDKNTYYSTKTLFDPKLHNRIYLI